jgi:hypothetical protein
MGDLSSREIEPDRTIADPFSHDGGREKSRKSSTQTAIESARLLTLGEAAPAARNKKPRALAWRGFVAVNSANLGEAGAKIPRIVFRVLLSLR